MDSLKIKVIKSVFVGSYGILLRQNFKIRLKTMLDPGKISTLHTIKQQVTSV